jgi:hypothetical protein
MLAEYLCPYCSREFKDCVDYQDQRLDEELIEEIKICITDDGKGCGKKFLVELHFSVTPKIYKIKEV